MVNAIVMSVGVVICATTIGVVLGNLFGRFTQEDLDESE